MLRNGSSVGKVMRGEAAAVINDARATTKHVNILKEGVEAEQSAEEEVRIRIAVSQYAPREIALVVRDALIPVREHAAVSVASAEEVAISGGSWDVVIVIGGHKDSATADVARTFARAGLPVAVIVDSHSDLPNTGLVGTVAHRVTPIIGSDAKSIRHALASWLVRATGKGLAMAACFPFARRCETLVLARECASQNAAIAALNLVPGSDLPVMAANQVRLAITYATLYGQGVTVARFVEMLAVIGAAVTYRSVAKSIRTPGLAIISRAAVGYAGTLFTGKALARYYERLDAEGGLGNVFLNMLIGIAKSTASSIANQVSITLGFGR